MGPDVENTDEHTSLPKAVAAGQAQQAPPRLPDAAHQDVKISLEMAEQEFQRFAEEMDIDIDTSKLDAEDLTEFNKQKGRIVRAIQQGHLVINDSGEAIYTPYRAKSRVKDPIVFHERTGASLMAMDGKKKNQDVAKTYAVMAEMCKVHPNVFAGLAGTDIKLCEALFALLMD